MVKNITLSLWEERNMLGLTFGSWFGLIGARVLGVLIAIICAVFCVYEGKRFDKQCEELGIDEEWYGTF